MHSLVGRQSGCFQYNEERSLEHSYARLLVPKSRRLSTYLHCGGISEAQVIYTFDFPQEGENLPKRVHQALLPQRR